MSPNWLTIPEVKELVLRGHALLEAANWYTDSAAAGLTIPPHSDRDFCDKFDFSTIDLENFRSLAGHIFSLGLDLDDSGHFAAALSCFEQITLYGPDIADAHFMMSMALTALGRFAEATPSMIIYYRHRAASAGNQLPFWSGEDLTGKTIAVYADGGLGDTIQNIRCLSKIAQKCKTLQFYVDPGLWRVIPNIKNMILHKKIETAIEISSDVDYVCSLSLVPNLTTNDPGEFSADIPYLLPDSALVAQWRAALPVGAFRIGICWEPGALVRAHNIGRSIPLAAFAPIAALPGVTLISLQLKFGLEQLDQLLPGMTVHSLGSTFNGGPDKVVDDLAVMASLDLVISADTSVAHIAAAAGFPVWLALKHASDWRWMQDRTDTPWYPTMLLFRQTTAGDWPDVMTRMAAAITELPTYRSAIT